MTYVLTERAFESNLIESTLLIFHDKFRLQLPFLVEQVGTISFATRTLLLLLSPNVGFGLFRAHLLKLRDALFVSLVPGEILFEVPGFDCRFRAEKLYSDLLIALHNFGNSAIVGALQGILVPLGLVVHFLD